MRVAIQVSFALDNTLREVSEGSAAHATACATLVHTTVSLIAYRRDFGVKRGPVPDSTGRD